MRRSLLLIPFALSLSAVVAAPASGRADDAKPDADEVMKRAPMVLKDVLARTKDDKRLVAVAASAVAVEKYRADGESGFCLRYETADAWPDLPSKPNGQAAGNGSVQVKILRGTAKTGVDCPFQPPKGCYYALSVYSTSVQDVQVSLWSMTGDRGAHARLETFVRASLRVSGVTMDEKPLRPFVIASDLSEDQPAAPSHKDK